MPNAISNFVGGLANGARQVLVDPAVDLGALAAKGINKGLDYVTGDNLSKTVNPKIDRAAQGIKQQATSEVDPTSIAGAIGEGLSVGLDNANVALGLVQLAKQVGKQGLKQLPKLLGKYQDAKDKKAQLQAAQEIREYVQKQAKTTSPVTSDVPAYQQRAYANEWNANNDIKMDTFKDVGGNQSIFPKRNMTDEFMQIDKKYTNPVSKDIAKTNVVKERGEFPSTFKNQAKTLTKDEAKYLDVPYKGSRMDEVKDVKKTVGKINKMSDKEFKEFMQSNASSQGAGYGPYWYDNEMDDLWKATYNSPGDYKTVKDKVIDSILHNHGLEQEGSLTSKRQNTIKNRSYNQYRKRYDKANLTPQERTAALNAEKNTNAALKAGWDPQTEPFDLYF